MDVECIQELQRLLPELDYEKLMVITEHLSSVVGVTKKEDLAFIEKDDFKTFLTPIQCRKVIQAFKQKGLNDSREADVSCVQNEQTRPSSSMDTRLTDGHAKLTPPQAQYHFPGSSLTKTQNSWISQFEIPWDKMPASLSQALLRGQRAHPADRRLMQTATKTSIEKDMNLPATPRLIMLGHTFLSSTKWMVSIEGKVAYVLDEHLGFADALSVFFACFYVFNLEYQEPACATLEFIQRFFARINPEDGTKCTATTGVSRKTGEVVKRKATSINNRVSSFLCQLTEFEWKNLD
ncbi:uncharacterized protein isoform X2 [Danio rerio]|uniref:Uncharacterized protein isoform X2 n=1 Tax=Danio rerio TaxID=7955 RepID=A0AC58IA99_DANRE